MRKPLALAALGLALAALSAAPAAATFAWDFAETGAVSDYFQLKSFHTVVIIRMRTTIMMLDDIGRIISKKMRQNEPQSMIAALTISSGTSL